MTTFDHQVPVRTVSGALVTVTASTLTAAARLATKLAAPGTTDKVCWPSGLQLGPSALHTA